MCLILLLIVLLISPKIIKRFKSRLDKYIQSIFSGNKTNEDPCLLYNILDFVFL